MLPQQQQKHESDPINQQQHMTRHEDTKLWTGEGCMYHVSCAGTGCEDAPGEKRIVYILVCLLASGSTHSFRICRVQAEGERRELTK